MKQRQTNTIRSKMVQFDALFSGEFMVLSKKVAFSREVSIYNKHIYIYIFTKMGFVSDILGLI